MQFSFVTTRNKNGQKKDAKSNAELRFVTNCRPNGQRRLGRPLKRLLEKVQASLLWTNPWRKIMMVTLCWILLVIIWKSASLTISIYTQLLRIIT